MAQVYADVQALLAQHEYLQLVETGEGEQKRTRVRCDLTQHEMLPRKDAIETHLKGKKFLKAKEWYCYDYSKYEPYIVQHRRKPKCLFCNVTNTILNRIPAEVEKHVNGKKFLRLKEHVTFTKRDGDEADDGTFDANAFEFENQQLIYSDVEDEEDGKPQKKKKNAGDDSDDDDDEDEDDDEELDDDDDDDSEVDDDMAEFYPQSEDEDDEHIRDAVKRLTVKKRKASADESHDETMQEDEVPAPKKQKAAGAAKAKGSKAKKGGK